MIFCDERKFIFFHIPKTAGSFIEKSICKQIGKETWESEWTEDNVFIKHVQPKEFFARYPHKADYTKISCCRNPWDYTLSFYSMHTQWPRFSSVTGCHFKDTGRIHPINDYKGFNEFIELGSIGVGPTSVLPRFKDALCNPITRFLTKDKVTKNAELWADHIIRFESLQEDINTIFTEIGLSPIDCNDRSNKLQNSGEPYDCSSKHKHYSKVYSPKAREIIANLNLIDCERFNYTYEKAP